MSSVATALAPLWGAARDALVAYSKATVFSVGVHATLNTLNQGWLLRLALRHEVHWLRLLATTFLLAFGGRSVVAALLGVPAPLAADGAAAPALLVGFYAIFYSPFDAVGRAYGARALRPLWQAVAALQVALSCAAAVQAARAVNAALPPPALVLFGLAGGTGGALLAELTNALLLPPGVFREPRGGPPPPGALALWGSLLFVALTHAAARGGALARALPALPAADAQLATAAVLVAVQLGVPGGAIMEGTARALELVPGVRAVVVPARIGPAGGATRAGPPADAPRPSTGWDWPLDVGVFGYHWARPGDALDAAPLAGAASPEKRGAQPKRD